MRIMVMTTNYGLSSSALSRQALRRKARPTVGRCQAAAMRLRGSGSAAGLASFNSQAAAVGIGGTAGAVGIPGAEGIVDRVQWGTEKGSGVFS